MNTRSHVVAPLVLVALIFFASNAVAKPIKIEINESNINETVNLEEDFQYGGHTYLNVLRHRDVEYFAGLKQNFKTKWEPEPVLRRYFLKSTSSLPSEISAVVGIGIDGSGKLLDLFVLRNSGFEEYDKETLRTVRASAPFPAPPKEWLGNDSVLRMAWTFTTFL